MLINDDCLTALKAMSDNSVDSLVTDPPAGISFMGKDWDKDKGGRDQWIAWMTEVMAECLRVMKPGAHGLVWAIPRTSHWTATALEDAGFEVRDVVTHLFGSGFPKSLDISKAIDKAAGQVGPIIGKNPAYREKQLEHDAQWETAMRPLHKHGPATEEAKQWQGFGTALKPASEHWVLVRKPCSEKTVAANVLKHGCGGLNIDQTRIKPSGGFPLRYNLSPTTLLGVYGDTLESLPDSFDSIASWPLQQIQDFALRTFSVLDFDSTNDKVLWRDVVREFRSVCKQQMAVPCDYGPTVRHVIEYVRHWLTTLDSPSDCPILFRLYDGLLRQDVDSGVHDLPSLSDVREYISHCQGSLKSNLLSDSNLRLFVVSVFSWCLYSSIRQHIQSTTTGRFPANLVLSHDDGCEEDTCTLFCPVRLLDEQVGECKSRGTYLNRTDRYEVDGQTYKFGGNLDNKFANETGGPSRFFYCAKASKSERNKGLDSSEQIQFTTELCKEENTVLVALLQKVTSESTVRWSIVESGKAITVTFPTGCRSIIETEINKIIESKILSSLLHWLTNENIQDVSLLTDNGSNHVANVVSLKKWLLTTINEKTASALGVVSVAVRTLESIQSAEGKPLSNIHSTVKPQKLMEYLITLITPPNGVVLDPFMGSGSTGVAAKALGFEFIGIERETEYIEIARRRIG